MQLRGMCVHPSVCDLQYGLLPQRIPLKYSASFQTPFLGNYKMPGMQDKECPTGRRPTLKKTVKDAYLNTVSAVPQLLKLTKHPYKLQVCCSAYY